jgi:hypothetical protein
MWRAFMGIGSDPEEFFDEAAEIVRYSRQRNVLQCSNCTYGR